MGQTPHGDETLAKVLVEKGYLTQEQLDECLKAYHEATRLGMKATLLRFVQDRGHLDARQAAEVRDEMRKRGHLPKLGGYELIAKLGQGGMGAVYKARQVSLDRIVALKVLPSDLARDPDFVKRFEREARLASKINHPNAIQVFDVGAEGGHHFIAMEFVSGSDVGRLLESGPLAEQGALEIVLGVAMALSAAHAEGVVHRDIKPANIMLTEKGVPKLADLGIARDIATQGGTLTRTGTSPGTPAYMSPEQAMADKTLDGRSDIYSLGITLFHMVCGQPPYSATSPLGMMKKHVEEPLPDPRQFSPNLSDGMVALIRRMTEKDPAGRFPNSEEVCAAIETLLGGTPRPRVAHATTNLSRVSLAAAKTVTPARPAATAKPRSATPKPPRPTPRPPAQQGDAIPQAVLEEGEPEAEAPAAEAAPQAPQPSAGPRNRKRIAVVAAVAGVVLIAAVLFLVLKTRRAPAGASSSAAPPSGAPSVSTVTGKSLAAKAFFPLGIYVDVPPPAGVTSNEDIVRFYRTTIETLKGMGFNTIANVLYEPEDPRVLRTTAILDAARDLGLKSIVQPRKFNDIMTGAAKATPDQIRADARRVADAIRGYDNVIAYVAHDGPVQPGWLETWKVLGGVMAAETGGLPGLNCYPNGAEIKRFNDAAAVGAYQFFAYPVRKGAPADGPLSWPVFTNPDLDDARRQVPGLPAWAWVQGFQSKSASAEYLMPTASEMLAICHLALVHGARGIILWKYAPPRPDGFVGLCDERGLPLPVLKEFAQGMYRVGTFGRTLIGCEMLDGVVKCEGKGDAAWYENGQGARYLALASRAMKGSENLRVTMDTEKLRASQLVEAISSERLALPTAAGRVSVEIPVVSSHGRLFSVPLAQTATPAAPTPATAQAGPVHFVAPDGKKENKGTQDSPWDIASVLAGTRAVKAGSTIYLRGGTYKHPDRSWASKGFFCCLSGTEDRPIHVRPHPGERAVIDGGLCVTGSKDLWFWDLEITVSEGRPRDPVPRSGSDPDTSGIKRGQGGLLATRCERLKFINLVIHEALTGVHLDSLDAEIEMHGCILYNNSFRTAPTGQFGCNILNRSGRAMRTISNCILLGGYPDDLTAKNTICVNNAANDEVAHLLLEGSILANPGTLVLEKGFVRNTRIEGNCFYGGRVELGVASKKNEDCVFANNILGNMEPMRAGEFKRLVTDGNVTIGKDAPRPTQQPTCVLRPNRYDPNRAHLAIYNWQEAASVEVDASAFLKDGERFRLQDPKDFFGPPVHAGVYRDGKIAVPVTGEFAAFVMFKDGVASEAAATPPSIPTPSPTAPASWTQETRRVKVASPQGLAEKDITYHKNTIGMEFVRIPAGEFTMGSPDGEAGRALYEGPTHKVRITKPFLIGVCEVTQGQYQRVMGANPTDAARRRGPAYPVSSVSWLDAKEFCKRLSAQDGAAYRLPTEAEWEYACRGGTDTPYFVGPTVSEQQAALGPPGPRPVATFPPNAFGLHDTHGNVAEWCDDLYLATYYTQSPAEDPRGPQMQDANIQAVRDIVHLLSGPLRPPTTDANIRVVRDGGFPDPPKDMRSAGRRWAAPDERRVSLGFRVAADGPPAPAGQTTPAPPPAETGPAYFIAPDGRRENKGTQDSPWDIASGLGGHQSVQPGSTIYLRGGTYRLPDRVNTSSVGLCVVAPGTAEQPINIRPWKGERVVIDGAMQLTSKCVNAWLWDLEIVVSEPKPSAAKSGETPRINTTLFNGGKACRLINLVFHGASRYALMIEQSLYVYGCIFYDVGTVNERGYHFGTSITLGGRSQNTTISDCLILGMTPTALAIDNPSAQVVEDVVFGGNTVTGVLRLCAKEDAWGFKDIRVRGNSIFGDVLVEGLLGAGSELAGNTIGGQLTVRCPPSQLTVSRNTRMGDPNAATVGGVRVSLRPNKYDPARANLTIFNWKNEPGVVLDAQGFLKDGDRFRLHDPKNLYGPPVYTGVCKDGRFHVPMADKFLCLVMFREPAQAAPPE